MSDAQVEAVLDNNAQIVGRHMPGTCCIPGGGGQMCKLSTRFVAIDVLGPIRRIAVTHCWTLVLRGQLGFRVVDKEAGKHEVDLAVTLDLTVVRPYGVSVDNTNPVCKHKMLNLRYERQGVTTVTATRDPQ